MSSRPRTPFEDTTVAVSRSQEQIRRLLREAGAQGVQFSEEWGTPPAFYVRFLWQLAAPDADAQAVVQAVRLKVHALPERHQGVEKTVEQRERRHGMTEAPLTAERLMEIDQLIEGAPAIGASRFAQAALPALMELLGERAALLARVSELARELDAARRAGP